MILTVGRDVYARAHARCRGTPTVSDIAQAFSPTVIDIMWLSSRLGLMRFEILLDDDLEPEDVVVTCSGELEFTALMVTLHSRFEMNVSARTAVLNGWWHEHISGIDTT
jgi:hypothetical protein